jgi:hypothetical protein
LKKKQPFVLKRGCAAGRRNMSMNVNIKARFNTKEELKEAIELFEREVGGEPADVDWESLSIEVNLPSHGDRLVFLDYLKEVDAEIIREQIDDDY